MLQCTWSWNRGENPVTDPQKQTEIVYNLVIHDYANLIDSPPSSKEFRPERPKDPDDLLRFWAFHLDDNVERDASEDHTNIMLWHDVSGVCTFPYLIYII
jgi:hypothetical protein